MSGVDITQIDAIGVETVEVVLSEYGPDLSRFPMRGYFHLFGLSLTSLTGCVATFGVAGW